MSSFVSRGSAAAPGQHGAHARKAATAAAAPAPWRARRACFRRSPRGRPRCRRHPRRRRSRRGAAQRAPAAAGTAGRAWRVPGDAPADARCATRRGAPARAPTRGTRRRARGARARDGVPERRRGAATLPASGCVRRGHPAAPATRFFRERTRACGKRVPGVSRRERPRGERTRSIRRAWASAPRSARVARTRLARPFSYARKTTIVNSKFRIRISTGRKPRRTKSSSTAPFLFSDETTIRPSSRALFASGRPVHAHDPFRGPHRERGLPGARPRPRCPSTAP